MNKIETFSVRIADIPLGAELTKQSLIHKIAVLEDVVQSLIDRIAKKEGTQLGVMAICSTGGMRYGIYENPLPNENKEASEGDKKEDC